MEKVNLSTLKQILPEFYSLRVPLYLWGKPSSGKTSIIRQFAQEKAKELGLKYSEDEFGPEYFTLKIIPLSQFDAPDLRGMPELIGEGKNRKTQFVPTQELPREGQGIIFFDELNLADDVVRAACYQYILEGRYSNIPCLKDKDGKDAFWRVAASNTEQDYSNVNSTGLALLRRFCHYEVEPEIDEVIDYLLNKDGDSRVIAYLKNYPDDLFPIKWDETLLDRKANPFPYTWEIVSNLIKDKKENSNLFSVLVAGCVGSEVAARFTAFCKTTQKIDLNKIIENPKDELSKIKEDQDKASKLYAVISGLASRWHKEDKALTSVKVAQIGKLLPPEFAVAFLKMILKKRKSILLEEKD
ncbi:AAA family ATPase, partial [bacterium]|nr:AAA family ATPase [bacterium]